MLYLARIGNQVTFVLEAISLRMNTILTATVTLAIALASNLVIILHLLDDIDVLGEELNEVLYSFPFGLSMHLAMVVDVVHHFLVHAL